MENGFTYFILAIPYTMAAMVAGELAVSIWRAKGRK